MSISQQTSSFNSSSASSHFAGQDDMATTKAKHFVKDLLKARIFLGRYIERRLINQQIGYRDIILVSAAEVELKRDLVEAQHSLRSAYLNIPWIGIADSEALGVNSSGLCITTEIENQPFGPFWFQIKSIKFREEEVMLSLKCIRHISDSFLEIEPILTRSTNTKKVAEVNDTKPDSTVETLSDTYNEIVVTLKSALSIRNVKEFVTFLFAFLIAIFTGSTAFVNFLGNFILALLREMSILIKNSTPMFLGLLDFFSKIVGGFYILLAMFFKPNNPVPIHQNKRSITYHNQRNHHQSDYYSREHDGQFD